MGPEETFGIAQEQDFCKEASLLLRGAAKLTLLSISFSLILKQLLMGQGASYWDLLKEPTI